MKIRVDSEKCQGHARCYGLAPEIFDVDDYGQASVILDEIPPELAGEGPARRGQLPRVRHRDHQRVAPPSQRAAAPSDRVPLGTPGPERVAAFGSDGGERQHRLFVRDGVGRIGATPPDQGEGAHAGHRQHDGAEGEGRGVAVDGARR